MRAFLLALVFVTVSAASAVAGQPEKLRVPTRAGDIQEIDGYILRPDGPGPFPAVIAMHGCGGLLNKKGQLTSRHDDWGTRLRDAGYVVIFPDSFGSRGHKSLCKIKNRPVTHSHRVGDIVGATSWLREQAFVDGARIALLGWSNGGTSVLRALEPGKGPKGDDFVTVVAFYPACRWATEKPVWSPRLKPLVLIGGADDWTPAEPCRKLAKNWKFRLVVFDGAYHNFDTPDMAVRVLKGRAFSANKDGTVHAGTDLHARMESITQVMDHFKSVFASSR